MTIAELLESQNMATVCHRENTYTEHTQADIQSVWTLDSYDEVCYNPMAGVFHIFWIVAVFIIVTYLIANFFRK